MFKFKPGDLVRVKDKVVVSGKNLSGSVAMIVGLENESDRPKDLKEVLNREIPYVIICGGIETYVWEEELSDDVEDK